MKCGICRRVSSRAPHIKLCVNLSGGSRADTYRQTDKRTGRRTISLIQFQPRRALLWRFNVCGNNKPSLGLHAMCPIFLTNFRQIYIFSTDIHKSSHYQILCRSDTCGQMDGHEEDNRGFSRLCERA